MVNLKKNFFKELDVFGRMQQADSLQSYLSNGHILAVMRVVLCNIWHIGNAVLLICGIQLSNTVGTLVLCEYILPEISAVVFLLEIKVKRK